MDRAGAKGMTRVADFNAERLTRFERRLDDLTAEVHSLRVHAAAEAEKSSGRDLAQTAMRSDLVRILEKLERIEARLDVRS